MTAAQCRTIGTVTGQLLAYAMETPDLQLTTQPIAIEEQHAGEMTVTLQACYTNGNDFYVRAAVTPEGRVLNNVLTRAWDDERLALTEWMGITKDAVLR